VIFFSIILHLTNRYTWNVSAQEDVKVYSFFFMPGGGYHGKHSPNAFTRTYCGFMKDLFGYDITIVDKPVSKASKSNIVWALNSWQKPMRKPERNKKTVIACRSIIDALHDETTDITIVSSSFGTVLAAQVGIMLADYLINTGKERPDVNLVMGASMVSKESKLYCKLGELRNEGKINRIIYDELQDPGDSATGICGKSRMGAYARGLRMSFVIFGKYKGQPSILNNNPNTGHLHLKRAQSVEKAENFLKVTLVEYGLAGQEIKEKAVEMLKKQEFEDTIQ
jgi:hypothetical protein